MDMARYWWLTTVEAEIRRVMVQSQSGKIVYEILS
jgi:hypothetical protein